MICSKKALIKAGTAFVGFIVGVSGVDLYETALAFSTNSASQSISRPPDLQLASWGIKPINVDQAFYSLAFVNDTTVFGAGSFDGLKRSNDGGETWKNIYIDTGGWSVSRVDFVNDKVGWTAGDSVLMKTVDGGLTWKRLRMPRYLHEMNIGFVNENIGYIAGDTESCSRDYTDECTYGNLIYKTVDGGKSWRKVYSDKTSFTVFQLKVIDENTVFVLNNADSVRRTTDGGLNWEVTYLNRNKAYQIARSPDGTIWLAGEKSLLKSVDRGKTWEPPSDLPQSFTEQNWGAIEFSPAGYGVVASDGSHLGVTLDGGKSWMDLSSPKIHFGLMFDIAIRGENVLISASADSNRKTVYWLPLYSSPIFESTKLFEVQSPRTK